MTAIQSNKRIGKILTSDNLHVYSWKVSEYPLSVVDIQLFQKAIDLLITNYQKRNNKLRTEVMIRQQALYTGLINQFVDRAPEWGLQQGLAVIPHKPAPRMPTKDEFENIDPRILQERGIEGAIEIPEYVFQITEDIGKKECLELMVGHGAFSMILTKLNIEELHQNWKEIFGKRVTDRQFTGIALFVPLFGAQSFMGAQDDELIAWLDGFDLFIGESKDERAIVIASKENIDELIEQVSTALPENSMFGDPEILQW